MHRDRLASAAAAVPRGVVLTTRKERLLNLSSLGMASAGQRPSDMEGLVGVGRCDPTGRAGRGGGSVGSEHPRSAPQQQLARCPS
jgi:hypothetical protein